MDLEKDQIYSKRDQDIWSIRIEKHHYGANRSTTIVQAYLTVVGDIIFLKI